MSGHKITCCVLTTCLAVFTAITSAFVPSYQYYLDDPVDVIKKNSECVAFSGRCYNTQQCCGGLTCAAAAEDGDSPETPGSCIRSKDLKPCLSSVDCQQLEVCAVLKYAEGQRYCLPSEAARVITSRHQAAAPRKHQAYSRLVAFGGSCESDVDCQPFVSDDPDTRLCCQQIRRGRQGARRICDRITPISVCIPAQKN